MAKLLSGDSEWRHLTAMDEYYQNGPLPTWIGWYVQHLPHWFHAGTAGATLALELVLVWMLFLPRRWRIVCFFIVTPWEIGVILTRELHFPQLSRAFPGLSLAGRPLHTPDVAEEVERFDSARRAGRGEDDNADASDRPQAAWRNSAES